MFGRERTKAERSADEASRVYRELLARGASSEDLRQALARREAAWRAVRIEREKGR